MALKIGSLFSGIGGLDLGIERATGGRTVWNCEQDEWCRRILRKHWPDAVQYTDVRKVDGDVEPVDVICGGFPCQNISVAGNRKGLAGEKSGLWSEYARIVRLLGPRYVFVENVPALRTLVSDNGLGRVLGDLAEGGYDAEWDCFPASSVGAPHIRDRIFIFAWRDDVADAEGGGRGPRISRKVGDDPGTTQGHAACEGGSPFASMDHPRGERREERRGSLSVQTELAGTQRAGGSLPQWLEHDFPPKPGSEEWEKWIEEHPTAQPGICRGPDGTPERVVPDRRRRLKALGNAVVPQAAGMAWDVLSRRAGVAP